MQVLEDKRPPTGLSVPVVTVLDDDGVLVEDEQRAVVRHVIQGGYGAGVVFSSGTTGEWDRVDNPTRQAVNQVCAEETAKQNAELAKPVECWAGVTSRSPSETLENLEHAIECGADAAVLAPLSIHGVGDPVRFVARDIADLVHARPRRIPIYLYDNADIAADPKVPRLRTRQVKALSRLDFVRGIKVSAPRKVLGHYTRAAASFRSGGDFAIYVGAASLIFEIFRPPSGPFAALTDHWNRYRLGHGLPSGVVSGPANALPREWARAWQVCRAGDRERMDQVRSVVTAFSAGTHASGGRRTIACLKRALQVLGVTTRSSVARGTPALARPDAERFDAAFERVRELAAARIGPPWVTRPAAGDPVA